MTAGASRAEMPTYDVERHCAEIASFGGSPSEFLRRSCFRLEQSAYDALKPRWDALPASMRRHCDSVARFNGSGSFSLLKSCVEMEGRAGQENQQFQFRR